jgi:molecular chaperone GrpE
MVATRGQEVSKKTHDEEPQTITPDEIDMEAAAPVDEVAGAADAPGAAGAAEAVEAAEPSLEELLAEALARADEYKDGWQRSRAELDNYRKRVEREREQREIELREDTLARILPVLDDFDLAMANLPPEADGLEWATAITMIYRKLHSQMGDLGLTQIEAEGQQFDPALHDAVMRAESPDHPSGQVIEVLRKGYRLKDKVIRPALVRVAV